jgi:hypothetical protein
MMTRFQSSKLLIIPALLLFGRAGWALADACDALPHADHPKTVIANGLVKAVVFLPDAERGYYRASRFDWFGVVGCLSYQGHTYFGEWFSKYDPLLNDSITGPVEEFRSDDGALGYNQAKPGDLFVKVGVGVLRKLDDSPYKFGVTYPLIDSGHWSTHVGHDRVTFQQHLSSTIGISYIYEKTLKLDKREPVLVLEHSLKNTGSKTIETEVYDHDFFMLDGKPTGPGMVVRFPFAPKANDPLTPGAKIEGKEILYQAELQPHQQVASYLQGYSTNPADYDLTVEDRNTGIGVEQSSDSAISRLYLWSIRTTICPEAYIHLAIPPGQTAHWEIRYRFFAAKGN